MASLVLGAAGAVVGSIFGGPLGASIGWAIGSALGGLLEPKKGQEGPRLSDLHIQNSQYGQPIPIAYGTVRIAGQVIWQTDLQEHKQTSGGKGGGPKVTTYSYSVSFAVMYCEGPILGYNRIWANKRLVYSVLDNDTLANFPFTPYLGSLDQSPDPTMEMDKGVGHVPGHRGYAYIVLDDIPVEAYGNAIPSLEAEIIASQNAKLQNVNLWYPNVPYTKNVSGTQNGADRPTWFHQEGGFVYISDYGSPSSLPPTYTRDKYSFDGNFLGNDITVTGYATPNPGGDFGLEIFSIENGDAAFIVSHDAGGGSIKGYWFYQGAASSAEAFGPGSVSSERAVRGGKGAYSRDAIFTFSGASPTSYVTKWNAPDGVPDGVILAEYLLVGSLGVSPGPNGCNLTIADDGSVWVAAAGAHISLDMWHLDADLNLITYWPSVTPLGAALPPDGFGSYSSWTVYGTYMVTLASFGNLNLYSFAGAGVFTLVDHVVIPSGASYGMCPSLGGGYLRTIDGIWKINAPITLKTVVDDISHRCGLVDAELDTDDLTQLVNGYVIAQQADGRSCLEPLMMAYFCDAVESGPVIKYVNRGSPPSETIDIDQLGAYSENEDPPALVTVVRAQESDLPRTINVSYFDINADYQVSTQLAKREVVRSTLDTSIAFALVLSATEGKAVADRMMYDSWAKRRRLSFSLPRKYAYLEPTDVIIVNGYTVVITQRDESVNGVLRFDSVATRSQIFGQSGAAGTAIGSGGFVPPSPPVHQLTQLLLLDLPLIQDSDFPVGHYAAMAGASNDTWGSANLYKSVDGGTTYVSLLTDSVADVIGTASTVLADFQGGNIFDQINTVTVVIGAGGGTLTSTSQLGVLNGQNMASLGDEIIQFTTATLIATSTYTLSGLLRGRRGTEWAQGLHGASEDFVMLPTSTNVDAVVAEIGLSRKYKAVTAGDILADATAVDFTNNAIAARPFAPVLLGGGRDDVGNVYLHWTPRTRTNGAWLNNVDVTLSDPNDYKLYFWTDGTYATLIDSATISNATTVTLSEAYQFSLWGSPTPATIYWSVRPIGTYDLGIEARGAT